MKLLFVCLGNICRSPAGENVMRHMLKEAGLESEVFCDSAGTMNYHTGKSPDSRMTATVESRGIEVTGSARQIKEADLENFDLILTMDNENYRNVMNLKTADANAHKIKKFVSFCSEHDDKEVPDPYYGGQDGFEHVVDLLEDGCSELLRQISKSS